MSLIRNIAGFMGAVDPSLIEYGTGSPVPVPIAQATPASIPAPVVPINNIPVDAQSLWPDLLVVGGALGAAWLLTKKKNRSSVGKKGKGSGKTLILLAGAGLLVYAVTRPGVLPAPTAAQPVPGTPMPTAPATAPAVIVPTNTAQVIHAGTPLASLLTQAQKITTIPKL